MKVALGICGSIAAYRSVELVKELKAMGHEVSCILTASAREFVSPLVLETFSETKVLSHDIFDGTHFGTDHISSARWADHFIVYGATANSLAKLANGFGDDFLSLQLLAFQGPVLLVPAMNPTMWEHPAVQANVKTLQERGMKMVGPIAGKVACGESGVGHVASNAEILASLSSNSPSTGSLPLAGKRVLLSAGPMRSEIDDVRYLQNRSSGETALELARVAKAYGATVDLLLGPVEALRREAFAKVARVTDFLSPSSYEKALHELFPQADIFLSAAAVLDFEVERYAGKLDKSDFKDSLHLALRLLPDFVKKCADGRKPHQKVVAFALQSGTFEEQLAHARRKLENKGSDAILLNSANEGLGPDAAQTDFHLVLPGGGLQSLGTSSKAEMATRIWSALLSSGIL
jgi:phosphopantothenoylcysteine decarboxylase/phosphopantothenate--cysteine ligase